MRWTDLMPQKLFIKNQSSQISLPGTKTISQGLSLTSLDIQLFLRKVHFVRSLLLPQIAMCTYLYTTWSLFLVVLRSATVSKIVMSGPSVLTTDY